MSRPPVRSEPRIPYWLTMAVSVLVVGVLTVGFVVVVLPQRFVLQGDLRASGVSFPTGSMPALPGEVSMRPPRVRPSPPPIGPAEALWDEVLPLLESGRYTEALPRFRRYLADHPGDVSARVEQGIALVRADRPMEAESVFRTVVDMDPDQARARIELARLLLARGAADEARFVLEPVRDQEPDRVAAALDEEIRGLASEIAAARDAEANVRAVGTAASDPADATAEAGAADRGVRETAVDSLVGDSLVGHSLVGDPLERARRALADGDLDAARTLYELAVRDRPDDAELLLEWADVLQFRLADLEGALTVLLERTRIVPPATEDRFRLGQLYVWIGMEDAAEPHLEAVVAARPEHADAWALLGEIRRWEGRRATAGDAYERALEVDPDHTVALEGRTLLTEDTRRAVADVDDTRLGPSVSFVRDSDGFQRVEARGYGSILPFPGVVEVEAGFRRVEGFDLAGAGASDDGGFFEVSAARWLREGTIRVAATAGAEDSELNGTRAVLGASLQARDMRGWNLGVEYRRAPAHTLASTFESLAADVTSQRLALDVYRGLPAGLELSGTVEGVRLRGAGETVGRFGSAASLTRVFTNWFRTGVTSRYLAFEAASPVVTGRRLYWDPVSFWSNGLLLELRTPAESDRFSAYLRAIPGVARAHERESPGPEWVRLFESEAGVRVRTGPLTLTLDAFYARGRAGDYTTRGLSLGVEVPR